MACICACVHNATTKQRRLCARTIHMREKVEALRARCLSVCAWIPLPLCPATPNLCIYVSVRELRRLWWLCVYIYIANFARMRWSRLLIHLFFLFFVFLMSLIFAHWISLYRLAYIIVICIVNKRRTILTAILRRYRRCVHVNIKKNMKNVC